MKRVPAAVHVHSEWSYDARWSLAKLASAFERRGCSVILAAEHDRDFSEERFQEYRRDCAAVSSDKFLIVPGIEYSDPTNTTHVLVWGDVPFIGEGLPTGDLLAAAHALGGIAVLAHPWRKDAWSTFDPEWTQYLFGIELWNRKSDGWCPEKRVALTLKRSSLLPFVSLDFHPPR